MDCNRVFSDYLQHSGIEDPKGKTNYDLLPADKAHELEKNDEEAMEKNELTVHYEAMPGPLGQSRYFRTTRLGIRDAEGKSCMLAMALDMTEDHERQLNSEATEEALIALQQEPTLVSPIKMLEVIRRRLNADYCYLARYKVGCIVVPLEDLFHNLWSIPKRKINDVPPSHFQMRATKPGVVSKARLLWRHVVGTVYLGEVL
jgi:hypothetical protein